MLQGAPSLEYAAGLSASSNDDDEIRHENPDASKKQSTTSWHQALQVEDDRPQSFVLSRERLGRVRIDAVAALPFLCAALHG